MSTIYLPWRPGRTMPFPARVRGGLLPVLQALQRCFFPVQGDSWKGNSLICQGKTKEGDANAGAEWITLAEDMGMP